MGYASKVVARKKEWDDIWYLSRRKRLDISITIIKLIVIVDAHICALWGFYHVDNRYCYMVADFCKNLRIVLDLVCLFDINRSRCEIDKCSVEKNFGE